MMLSLFRNAARMHCTPNTAYAQWCWLSLCKFTLINLIWVTTLRTWSSGYIWRFSWLIGLPGGEDTVTENCERTPSQWVQQDQTWLIGELTQGFERKWRDHVQYLWYAVITVIPTGHDVFDPKEAEVYSGVPSSVCSEMYRKNGYLLPFLKNRHRNRHHHILFPTVC